ncbi:MAG TPA: hypothetical protein PK970_05010 [Hyphomicrobiaceae bacterium]|nr:hypothetical protein [Candidatus Hydrogenedentota bacterium]HRK18297.1 hypothetical protein [Hyphomicrobiaceae bacterium]
MTFQSANILAILQTLTGAGVALAAVYLAHFFQMRREQERRMFDVRIAEQERVREKGELLYTQVHRYGLALTGHWLDLVGVMKQKLTLDQCNDLFINRDHSELRYEQLELNVRLYFPSIYGDLELLLERREAGNKIASDFKRQYKTGQLDGSSFVRPMCDAMQEVDFAVETLKTSIVNCIFATTKPT